MLGEVEGVEKTPAQQWQVGIGLVVSDHLLKAPMSSGVVVSGEIG